MVGWAAVTVVESSHLWCKTGRVHILGVCAARQNRCVRKGYPLERQKKFRATEREVGDRGHLPTDGAQGYSFGRQDITRVQF